MPVEQELPSFYSAMRLPTREALVREEVQYFKRLNCSKLSKEQLMELVCQPRAPKENRLTGDSSYRVLWHCDLSHEFNYALPGISGQRTTDGVITPY